MSFLILRIPQENIKASIVAVVVLAVMIFFYYLAFRPKKSKEKMEDDEEIPLSINFQTDPNLSTENDFAQYAKLAAKEVRVPKQNLVGYLVRNKCLLVTTYQKNTKRKIENFRDMSDIFAKIQQEY